MIKHWSNLYHILGNQFNFIILNSSGENTNNIIPLNNSEISMIQQNQNYSTIIPPNPSDSSMMSEQQTYETFFGRFDQNNNENSRFLQNKKECNQKLKNIEKDYSKISSYYDEMSNIVMSQNQDILRTNNILGGAAEDMVKAKSELKDSQGLRQAALANSLRMLLMVCLVIFILGFVYLV